MALKAAKRPAVIRRSKLRLAHLSCYASDTFVWHRGDLVRYGIHTGAILMEGRYYIHVRGNIGMGQWTIGMVGGKGLLGLGRFAGTVSYDMLSWMSICCVLSEPVTLLL